MAFTAEQLLAMKQKIQRLQTQRDQCTGAITQLKGRLKTEFGAKSLADARKKLEELSKQEEVLSKEIDSKVEEFKEKYGV